MTNLTLQRLFSLSIAALMVWTWVYSSPANATRIQTVTSKGGITAWLVEDRQNPIISMRFRFKGGSALDPDGKQGLADFVASTIDEGAGDLDSQAFRTILENRSIGLSFSAGRDNFNGQLKTLVRDQDKAFSLLSLALTKPRFDTEPVQRIRAQIISSIRTASQSPHTAAGKTLFQTYFDGHPYGKNPNGDEKSISGMSVTDLKTFTRNRFAKNNLIIGVVGDITPEKLGPLLDKTFGSLPEKATPWDIPETHPDPGLKTIVKEMNVPQSSIAFAAPGIKRDDPDFYAAYVMNHILGGGSFTSRLYQQVREKRGLVYSVYTSLMPFDKAGIIFGGAATNNAKVKETLSVIRQEWEKFVKSGVSQQELKDAKTFITGSFPLRFTSSDNIAAMLVGIQSANLGIDYIDRRNSLIDAVTLDDVERVAKRLLKPQSMLTVVVGKPEGISE